MKRNVVAQKLWACLIACAILLSGVFATVSHASASPGGQSTFTAICTANGIKWVDLQTAEVYESQQASLEVETAEKLPCPVCVLGFVGPLPAASDFISTYSHQPALTFSIESDSIRQQLAFSQSNPRAPPRI